MNLLRGIGGKNLWKVTALVMVVGLTMSLGCQKAPTTEKTFGEDVEFLKKYHKDTIVLADESGQAKVVVVPAYQGRVMTSTAKGDGGTSYGWINYEHIASQKIVDHMNAFGGEERFWLGPEGGQFSIFFKPEAKFEMDQWQTPAAIDSEPYKVVESDKTSAKFTYETKLTNYSKTEFSLKVDRTVELIDAEKAAESLGVEVKDVSFVGYRTINVLTNTGEEAWSKESGLLSIWLLGMYKPSPEMTVVIPFNKGEESELGQIVNDTYFGKVPAERLVVEEEVLYFSADGKKRTKIGLTPQRSKEVAGSYDPTSKTLTIVKYNKPGPEVTEYVNSMWEIQEKPFAGDTVNSYNDGPNDLGETMGPFYEIETSSPALALEPGKTGKHISETYHFQGEETVLDPIAKKVFGVSIEQIKNGLKQEQPAEAKPEQEGE
ncbi:MAG: hypothetical protein PVH19_11495 [Planctomycetia bacterium]